MGITKFYFEFDDVILIELKECSNIKNNINS